MIIRKWALLICCLTMVQSGCNTGAPTTALEQNQEAPTKNAQPAKKALESNQLVGKWRLVRAGGQPPILLFIKSQEIDVAADGTWTSRIEVQPPHRPADVFHGQGTWSLADHLLSCKYISAGTVVIGAGPNYGKSSVWLESGRLLVDPDCFMQVRINGTPPVEGVYER